MGPVLSLGGGYLLLEYTVEPLEGYLGWNLIPGPEQVLLK